MEPTKQQIKQDQIDNFNKTDVRSKEWRDQNTSTHSFVADINHTLEEMGQRGFSFSKMNSLMGNQIAQHARTISDRRYLGLLDEIETPGGSWGNTQEGLKLKQVTWDQIDADENQKVRNERAARLETKDKLVDVLKAEVGGLLNELRAAKPKDKAAIQEKIGAILSSSRASGIGTEIHTYHTNMVKGMEGGTAGGSAVIRGFDDVANPDLDPTKTIRNIHVEALENNLSDVSIEQRKQILNESTNGWYATLDKEGQEKANKLLTDFRKIAEIPELIKSKKRLTKLFNNRELVYKKGGVTMEQKLAAALGKLSNEIPDGLTKIMNRQALELEEVFAEEYSKFSDTLEKLPIDEGAAYGYNGWSPQNKQDFNEKNYKEKIEPLFKKFDDELKAFQEAENPKVVEEETHEEKYSALNNDKAPRHYLELHDMMYPEPSGEKTRVRPSNLLERFKIAVFGLQAGATLKEKGVANFHKGLKGTFIADDVLDWFEKSVGDDRDPINIKKKIQQLWDWGLYIIQRQEHYRINNMSNLSKEAKESRIKLYDKGIKAEKMPESIKDLSGGKEILTIWEQRNPWPPKEGTTKKKIKKAPRGETKKQKQIRLAEEGKKALEEEDETGGVIGFIKKLLK